MKGHHLERWEQEQGASTLQGAVLWLRQSFGCGEREQLALQELPQEAALVELRRKPEARMSGEDNVVC